VSPASLLNRARRAAAEALGAADEALTASASYLQDVLYLAAIGVGRSLREAACEIDVRDVCKSCGVEFERCRLNAKMVCTGCQWAEGTTARA